MEISKYSNAYGKTFMFEEQSYDNYNESNLKRIGINCDSFEKIDLLSFCKIDVPNTYSKSDLKAIGENGLSTSSKNVLFYSTYELMKDYYEGSIDKEGVKNQIFDYAKQYVGTYSESKTHEDKVRITSAISDLYEYVSRANTRNAVNMNQKDAKSYWNENGVREKDDDTYSSLKGTVYYDSKYYRQCEDMQKLFRDTFNEIADKYGVERAEYETIEKNTKFSLDGGITFNGVWNHSQYQTNHYWMEYEKKIDIVDNNFVPPENFKYAYTNDITKKSAKKLMDYIKQFDNSESKKSNNLLMELNYGSNSQKQNSKKIKEFLRGINVEFLISTKTNSFGNYYRMVSY